MNNEEKILPENETPVENTNTESVAKSKPSKGLLAGIIGGAIALIAIVVVLVILLAGGKEKCDGHVDADDDYLCDKCGDNYDDGDEAKPVSTVTVVFKVQLDNGDVLSGAELTLTRGDKTYNAVSATDGTVRFNLDPGAYSIEYNYDTLPEYCIPSTFGVKVTEETSLVTLTITDNKPDGSVAKPFPIMDAETEIEIAAGAEVYYSYRGSSIKYLSINVDGVEINYNGTTYNASEGNVTVLIQPDLGSVTVFSVKNTTSSSISTIMNLVAPLGSNENPEVMTSNDATAFIGAEEVYYYQWVADKAGVLVLNCNVEKSNLSLTKILENDISVTTQTEGSTAAYISVSAGESIIIGVSMLEAAFKMPVPFNVRVYDGTESDPVPVYGSVMDLSFAANSSVVFKLEYNYVGKVLAINDEGAISVVHASTTHVGGNDTKIYVELTGNTFTINNDSDHINGITFSITNKSN